MNIRPEDILAMARTLWGEARGESMNGQIAVAWSIRNRAENPGWWSRKRGDGIPDDTVEAVCLAPAQYSCWWDGQAAKVRSRTKEQLSGLYDLAEKVLSDQIPDPTDGADHYHTIARPGYATRWPPQWAKGRVGITIGRHIFYKIGLTGK